jgi:hypothetical protein
MSVRLSVRTEQRGSYWTDFSWNMKLEDFSKSVYKIQSFIKLLTTIPCTSHEDQCILVISCWVLLRMRNISVKIHRENQIHFIFNTVSLENRAVYYIMWKNMAEPDRSQVTKWRTRFAFGITKDKHTHTHTHTHTYTLRICNIYSFPRRQWLGERVSFIHYYLHCLSYYLPAVSRKMTHYSRITGRLSCRSIGIY